MDSGPIHHPVRINNYCAGVFLGLSDANLVAHNEIHDMPHHGINLGANGFGRNILEFNRMSRTCQENRDLGAINCWMDVPERQVDGRVARSGHVIRYNHISDTGRGGRASIG